MSRGDRAQRAIGQGVSVDEKEAIGVEQRKRASWTARRTEQHGFPRIADLDAELRAVADDGGHALGPVVQIQHDPRDARRPQPLKNADHDRRAGDGHRRFRARVGKRAKTRGEARRQHQRRPVAEVGHWVTRATRLPAPPATRPKYHVARVDAARLAVREKQRSIRGVR